MYNIFHGDVWRTIKCGENSPCPHSEGTERVGVVRFNLCCITHEEGRGLGGGGAEGATDGSISKHQPVHQTVTRSIKQVMNEMVFSWYMYVASGCGRLQL